VCVSQCVFLLLSVDVCLIVCVSLSVFLFQCAFLLEVVINT